MEIPTIELAHVKVMRSFDYCHFEVSLGTSAAGTEAVDELRKMAARLADKAVEQYKVAKENARRMECDDVGLEHLESTAERIRKKPEADWTPEEQAVLKTLADRAHRKRRQYDYQDDWEEEDWPEDDDDSLYIF